jgi:hypothetical protein
MLMKSTAQVNMLRSQRVHQQEDFTYQEVKYSEFITTLVGVAIGVRAG